LESYRSDISVSGTVSDEKGEPLIGVNIQVRGTTKGTSTDFEGHFVIEGIAENSVLIVTYVGYQTQEILINNQHHLSITLMSDSELCEEVIVVGYGIMKKSDLTGSVVRADIDAKASASNTSIMESLRGYVPGLDIGQITKTGQEPSMQIRGKSTLAGSNDPLVVVDGVIYRGNINNINPSDIESVDILKDASAAAVYGSQAANGVIILTTKKGIGSQMKPIISYSGSYSIQNPVKELIPPDLEGFYHQKEESIIFQSRTEESGYLEPNPNWEISNLF